MKRPSTVVLVIAAGLSTLGGCDDAGTAPHRESNAVDTTASAPITPVPHLLSGRGLSWLDVAASGDTTPYAPSVLVADQQGRYLANVIVDFAVVSGGGTLAETHATSNENGLATAGAWRLGTTPGRNVVRATSPSTSDTIYIALDGVEVGTTNAIESLLLDRVDGHRLPILIEMPYTDDSHLTSGKLEFQGSRFVFTWIVNWDFGSVDTLSIGGTVIKQSPYLLLLPDYSNRRDVVIFAIALPLADGRVRIGNFSEQWPIFGSMQDFKRAP